MLPARILKRRGVRASKPHAPIKTTPAPGSEADSPTRGPYGTPRRAGVPANFLPGLVGLNPLVIQRTFERGNPLKLIRLPDHERCTYPPFCFVAVLFCFVSFFTPTTFFWQTILQRPLTFPVASMNFETTTTSVLICDPFDGPSIRSL